jgi:hypothetical protein
MAEPEPVEACLNFWRVCAFQFHRKPLFVVIVRRVRSVYRVARLAATALHSCNGQSAIVSIFVKRAARARVGCHAPTVGQSRARARTRGTLLPL